MYPGEVARAHWSIIIVVSPGLLFFAFIMIMIFFLKMGKKSRILSVESPSFANSAYRHTKQHDFSVYIRFSISRPPLKNSFLELHSGLTSELIQSSPSKPAALPVSQSTHLALFLLPFSDTTAAADSRNIFRLLSLLHTLPCSPHRFSFLTVKISPFSLYGFLKPENRGNLNLAIMTTVKHFAKSRVENSGVSCCWNLTLGLPSFCGWHWRGGASEFIPGLVVQPYRMRNSDHTQVTSTTWRGEVGAESVKMIRFSPASSTWNDLPNPHVESLPSYPAPCPGTVPRSSPGVALGSWNRSVGAREGAISSLLMPRGGASCGLLMATFSSILGAGSSEDFTPSIRKWFELSKSQQQMY